MINQCFITVIVPTYKDLNSLIRCIDALSKQTYPVEKFEILVINNAPNDALKLIAPPNNLFVVEEVSPGSYAARNKGLRYAKGEIIAFTDSDCVPPSDWIWNAVKVFSDNSNIDRLTGPVKIFREPDSSWFAWKFESITAFNQRVNVSKGVSVTANLFVKRTVFDNVGIFDANLFSGGDIEWNERATSAGFNLFFDERVFVSHPARVSIKEIIRKSKRVVGGGYLRAKKEERLLMYTIRHFAPPIRYISILVREKKSLADVVYAGLLYWGIKIYLVIEIVRLYLGGKPQR